MNRYVPITFSAIFLLFAFFPCQVLAASITETKAAIGKDCVASGDYSTAMGRETTASGLHSTAMGYESTASASNSTAMGNQSTAMGYNSTAMGKQTTASGYASTAMGHQSTASGAASTAMGHQSTASGDYSWVGGRYMQLTDAADNTFVWGYSESAQPISTSNAFLIFPAGQTGKVGIGTSSPNELLEIGGTGRAFFGDGGGDNRKGLLIDGIQGSNAARIEAYDYGSGTGLDLVINTSGDGSVGIGVSEPNYLLHVNGSAGKPGGGNWSNSSDERLKDIVGEYPSGLDEIEQLKPVIFYYKAGNPRDLPSDEKYVGFIAQEVREVFPEAVTEGQDGYLDFNMHSVNVAMVNAIKELKEDNDAIKADNDAIKAENDAIRNENEFLRVENTMLKKDIEKIKKILGI